MSDDKIQLFEGFTLDLTRGCLLRGGEPVHLRPQAFEVLKYLVEKRGRLISKDELIDEVWQGRAVTDGSLSKCIEEVREALGDDDKKYVQNVPRRGYIFDPGAGERELGEAIQVRSEQIDVVRVIVEEEEETGDAAVAARTTSTPGVAAARPGLGSGIIRKMFLRSAAGLLILALAAGAAYYISRRGSGGPTTAAGVKSLAVLPFRPLLPGGRDEVLELGMADTLITRLSALGVVAVRPVSAVRRYTGLEQDAAQAGRELGVEAVLDGTVQRAGERVRVTARLVRVTDGGQLWSGQFDEKFTDIFGLQDAICSRVAGALALHLSGEEERRLTKRHTSSAAAYELYLRGRYHLFKLMPTEVRKGGEFFQEAVNLDPAYALAYTGIADAYRTLPITSDVAPNDAFPKAKEAVTKALELDDSLAEAHAISGWIKFWFDWDWAGSESEFRRAIDLNPNNADARRGYAHLLSNTGRHEEALREVARARELDPLSLITNTLQGQFLHSAGRDDEAVRSFERAFELDPNFWVAHVNLANVFIRKKMYGQALAQLAKAREQSRGNTHAISVTGHVLALSGERERARGVLEELRRLSGERHVPPYNLAVVHHGLGEREETLAWLERAYEERDVLLTFAAVDPKWDSLRGDPRFVSLLERMNLRK